MEKKQSNVEKIGQIRESIENLSVLELVGLVKSLEEHWGVTAAAPAVAVAAAAGAAAGGEALEAEEQTEFSVFITNVGANKIQVIKVVRELYHLGLKEAKAVVDNVPGVIKEKVSRAEAEEAKKKIEEVGASVEIK